MVTFWPRVKYPIFNFILCCRVLCYFWKNSGYFLYQHLVALVFLLIVFEAAI